MKHFTLEKVYINVTNVEKALATCMTSEDILRLTLVKNHSNVVIVRNLLHANIPWFNMKHFTLGKVYITVSNVEKALVVCATSRDISLLTLVKNH